MFTHRLIFLTSSLLLLLSSFAAQAQTTPKSGVFTDEPTDNKGSHVLRFSATGAAANKQVVLNVLVRESDNSEPVMGATVLLRREKPVRMYGKVTGPYGACALNIAPDTYAVRVQVTGWLPLSNRDLCWNPGPPTPSKSRWLSLKSKFLCVLLVGVASCCCLSLCWLNQKQNGKYWQRSNTALKQWCAATPLLCFLCSPTI